MITPAVSPTASFIDVRHLMKRYDDRLVLNDLDLTVDRGETCVIIGGSGSGKSTFARLLVGIERPDSGEIWYSDTFSGRVDPQVALPSSGKRRKCCEQAACGFGVPG